MSDRELAGLVARACAAGCIGPILGVWGAIATVGVVFRVFIGGAALTGAMSASHLADQGEVSPIAGTPRATR